MNLRATLWTRHIASNSGLRIMKVKWFTCGNN
jgi:hypothetical protein